MNNLKKKKRESNSRVGHVENGKRKTKKKEKNETYKKGKDEKNTSEAVIKPAVHSASLKCPVTSSRRCSFLIIFSDFVLVPVGDHPYRGV